jgi:hypothetical protein
VSLQVAREDLSPSISSAASQAIPMVSSSRPQKEDPSVTRISTIGSGSRRFDDATSRLKDCTCCASAATALISSGVSPKAVQAILGHRSAAFTLTVYGHIFDADLDEVAARLDNRIVSRSHSTAVVRELSTSNVDTGRCRATGFGNVPRRRIRRDQASRRLIP